MADTDIQKVLNGDVDAYRFIVREHKDKAYTLAISVVKDEALAQDVVQVAFIKAYKKLDTFKKEHTYQQQSIPREIKLSWAFMGVIIVLGITTSVLITHLQTIIIDIPLNSVKTVFDFAFIVFVLLQLETLFKYTFKSDKIPQINQLRES